MKYQSDYGDYIQKDGCLICSIVSAVEEYTCRELSVSEFLDLIADLYSQGAISDENDIGKPGAYVWNHEAVFNETFKKLNFNQKVRYNGRIYMPWEEARGKKSFGFRAGDFLILQIQTTNGGHFRLPNHDPWRPGTTMVDIKSLRYYRMTQ